MISILIGVALAVENSDSQRNPPIQAPFAVIANQAPPSAAPAAPVVTKLSQRPQAVPNLVVAKKPPTTPSKLVPKSTANHALPSNPSNKKQSARGGGTEDGINANKIEAVRKPEAPLSSVDTAKLSNVQAIAKSMVEQLMSYYTCENCQNGVGGIVSGSGNNAKSFQWYEGGLFWGIMGEYMKTAQDFTHKTAFGQALTLASYRNVGNFLGNTGGRGGSVLAGKYNDDVLWWSFGTMSGAEIFGADAQLPGG